MSECELYVCDDCNRETTLMDIFIKTKNGDQTKDVCEHCHSEDVVVVLEWPEKNKTLWVAIKRLFIYCKMEQ